ncbi:hypothetical protein GO013_01945 [Pseudodesulfovibrio sp. JC047]|uniref:hypothetical protein n=1 Tax=Pseudodesulfovibrio sp. JC047 TaxID=2683199 RepID=UPI0013D52548|nr:hypothetical protein [Pseudodesulfovibrio sp. JC047]NDV18181.1 hypothetical protein [Pseudodesulfovibrio sp. JC047]
MTNNHTDTTRDSRVEQELKELRDDYQHLWERKVRTEQDVDTLTTQLETLKQQALAEYGTSDINELQTLLEEKRQQNEKVVADYREHIQQIQTELEQVENAVDGEKA